jgi:hypothetical protein
VSRADAGALQLVGILAAIAAFGASLVVQRRGRLRPWMLWLPLTTALLIVPMALPLINDLRHQSGGDSAGWGRLGEVIILLWLVPLFSLAAGALVALLVLLPREGFATREAARRPPRTGPWYGWLFRSRTEAEMRTRMLVSLGSIIVVGVLWLLGVRPG